jgi:hypothetical protein
MNETFLLSRVDELIFRRSTFASFFFFFVFFSIRICHFNAMKCNQIMSNRIIVHISHMCKLSADFSSSTSIQLINNSIGSNFSSVLLKILKKIVVSFLSLVDLQRKTFNHLHDRMIRMSLCFVSFP